MLWSKGRPVNLAQWKDLLKPGVWELASDGWLNPERRVVDLEFDQSADVLVLSSWHEERGSLRSVITKAEVQAVADNGNHGSKDMILRHLAIVAPQYQFADEAVVEYE